MPTEFTTHTTLLARLADGTDQTAWREFCDRYADLIRGFCRRRQLQPADCDDVLQSVLMALSKAMPGFEYDPAKGKFRSYLKTIVLHAIVQKSCEKQGEAPLYEDGQGPAADPEIERIWQEEWQQHHLRRAMRTIEAEFNAADRAAFDAYAVGGRDVHETAQALGLSVQQVYQAKYRITKRLAEIVEEQVRDEG